MISPNVPILYEPTLDLAPLPEISDGQEFTEETVFALMERARNTQMHLRFLRPDDDEATAHVVRDNLERFSAHGEDWATEAQTVRGARRRIARLLAGARAGLVLPYGNVLGDRGDDGPVVGEVTLCRPEPQVRAAELGVWIDGEFEGQGLVRRSALGLLAYAQRVWNLEYIVARTSLSNLRAHKSMQRAGFQALDLEGPRYSTALVGMSVRSGMSQWWGRPVDEILGDKA